jgi:two-component system, LytTR family, response regulator
MIKTIILDDEQNAGFLLAKFLERSKYSFEVLANLTDPRLAKNAIDTLQPDLVFVDIDMPYMTGFEVISQFVNPDFEVIFVTGYNQYGIKACQLNAVGYVLKPIDEGELEIALTNAKHRIDSHASNEGIKNLVQDFMQHSKTDKRIGVPSMDGIEYVKASEIIRCEGLNKCTKIITISPEQNLISSYSIGEFTDVLEPLGFFLCHRSHLINLNMVKKIFKDGSVQMDDEAMIPIARRRKQEFIEIMNGGQGI